MKAGVVNKDERENGLRMILNLGHTVGHAIEQATRYKALLHGEAVGWGMIAALYLGRQRGTISGAQFERYCRDGRAAGEQNEQREQCDAIHAKHGYLL